jgi:hypothetical protein
MTRGGGAAIDLGRRTTHRATGNDREVIEHSIRSRWIAHGAWRAGPSTPQPWPVRSRCRLVAPCHRLFDDGSPRRVDVVGQVDRGCLWGHAERGGDELGATVLTASLTFATFSTPSVTSPPAQQPSIPTSWSRSPATREEEGSWLAYDARNTVERSEAGPAEPAMPKGGIRRAKGPGSEVAVNSAGSENDHCATTVRLVRPGVVESGPVSYRQPS